MTAQIIVVNDDLRELNFLKKIIEDHGHYVTTFEKPLDCLHVLIHSDNPIDVVIVELSTGSDDAKALLDSMNRAGLDIPVLVLSASNRLIDIVEHLRAGAFDFIARPVERESLFAVLSKALKLRASARRQILKKTRSPSVSFSSLIADGPEMVRAMTLSKKAASMKIPVMIEGEAGVGKATFAKAIHCAGDRSSRTFVSINCGAGDSAWLSQEIFGTEVISANGSKVQLGGRLQEAEGGTLFLREVSQLSSELQVKLLRLVEGVLLVGDESEARRPNVRLIVSTTKDMIEEVRSGNFREDLYYRLSVFPITITPLRRRLDDIEPLAKHLIDQISSGLRRSVRLEINSHALNMLKHYDWPGNVRQLEGALSRAVALCDGHELTEADFPQIYAQVDHGSLAPITTGTPVLVSSSTSDRSLNEWSQVSRNTLENMNMSKNGKGSTTHDANRAPDLVLNTNISSMDENGHVRTLADIEEELIRFALGFYNGQMSQVARKLGIGRSTLYRKLKDYGIDPDDPMNEVA